VSRSTLWWVLAVALPMLGALVAPLPAVDLAYQLRAGGGILDSGAIPALDSWTFTAGGTPWLDQQWGAQVVLAGAYRMAGWTGLAILRAGLVGLALGLLLLAIRRRAPGLGPRPAALLVIGAFVVMANALALRPQLLAIDLFAATLLLLELRHSRPRAAWLVPLVAVAWANVHGTFLLAPALCGWAWLADLAAAPEPGPGGIAALAARHRSLLVGLVAAAATLVTPFGAGVWGYVADLASNPTIAGRVSEWQPPALLSVAGAVVWLSVLAAGALVVRRLRHLRRVRAARPDRSGPSLVAEAPGLLALLAFGLFAVISGRGTAWWPLVAAVVIAPWLGPDGTSARPLATLATPAAPVALPPTPPRLRRLNAGLVAVLVLAGIALLPAWRPMGAAGVPEGTLSHAPQGIAAVLRDLRSAILLERPPAVWNPQAWGSWLEFAAPEYEYALDSRIELFPPELWADADAIHDGAAPLLSAYHVDVVVTDHATDGSLETALLTSSAWLPVALCPEGDVFLSAATAAAGYGTSVCQ
jgi:hypothetical protein